MSLTVPCIGTWLWLGGLWVLVCLAMHRMIPTEVGAAHCRDKTMAFGSWIEVRATGCCLRLQRFHFIVLAEVIVLLTQAVLEFTSGVIQQLQLFLTMMMGPFCEGFLPFYGTLNHPTQVQKQTGLHRRVTCPTHYMTLEITFPISGKWRWLGGLWVIVCIAMSRRIPKVIRGVSRRK